MKMKWLPTLFVPRGVGTARRTQGEVRPAAPRGDATDVHVWVRTFVFLRPIMPKNHEKYPMAPSASPCPLYPFRWLEVRVRWLDP